MGESDSKENYCKDLGSERVLVTRGAVVDLEIFLQGGGGGVCLNFRNTSFLILHLSTNKVKFQVSSKLINIASEPCQYQTFFDRYFKNFKAKLKCN